MGLDRTARARLGNLGISGAPAGARQAGRVTWAMDIQSQAYLNGLLAYQPHPSITMYPNGWGADPAVLDNVLDHTLTWAMADADLAHVSTGSISIGVPPPQALPLTRTQIIGNFNALATGYAKKRTRVRNLTLESPTALGMSQHNQEPEARAAMVADLREQILTAPRDTLTLARVDLDDMILTPDKAHDLGLTTRPIRRQPPRQAPTAPPETGGRFPSFPGA